METPSLVSYLRSLLPPPSSTLPLVASREDSKERADSGDADVAHEETLWQAIVYIRSLQSQVERQQRTIDALVQTRRGSSSGEEKENDKKNSQDNGKRKGSETASLLTTTRLNHNAPIHHHNNYSSSNSNSKSKKWHIVTPLRASGAKRRRRQPSSNQHSQRTDHRPSSQLSMSKCEKMHAHGNGNALGNGNAMDNVAGVAMEEAFAENGDESSSQDWAAYLITGLWQREIGASESSSSSSSWSSS